MASRDFNGSTSAVTVGDIAALNDETTLSYMFWNQLDDDTTDAGLVSHLTIGISTAGWGGYFDYASAAPPFDETMHWLQYGGGGLNNFHWQSFRVVTGEWQHASYCWSNADEPAETYRIRGGSTNFLVQNTEQAGTSPGPATTGDPSTNIYYGDVPTLANTHLDGRMAHILIFTKKLSAEEAFEYALRPNMAHDNLQVWSPLWGRDDPEIDLSGNGNTGTLSATAYSDEGPPIFWG